VLHILAVRLAPYVAAWLRLLANRLDAQTEPPTIKSLAAAGLGQRAIAARLGITRHQVRRALA
jgi:DNA invertase Pin-like site-specific DNA recombinase